MDLLDNAINKAKEVIYVAYKKTGEVVTTERQRFDVASLKSKRDKDFLALGKLWFEIIKDDESVSDEVKAIVNEIKQKNEKIEELNTEILNTKNKRVCPNCSAAIDNNATFCSSCGSRVSDGE